MAYKTVKTPAVKDCSMRSVTLTCLHHSRLFVENHALVDQWDDDQESIFPFMNVPSAVEW